MCGIAGTLHFDGKPADAALLCRLTGALRHRGPDAEGVYIDVGLGLAHARLSIVDVARGRQPMCNEDRSIWITYNGEIFNHVELREELVARGHTFATRADTEVIVHLYEEEGEDCVERLNGQWAFAIWDERRRVLFASRDRFGVRPFFYTVAGREFVFASEIKALLQHNGVEAQVDIDTLDQIFTFWAPLPPRTFFRNIHQLAPGHNLTVRDGCIETRRYWRPEYPQAADVMQATNEQEAAEQLRELVADATRLRLRSDVPVGAYLSGGLDSTATTALAAKTNDRLKTFSLTFDDAEFDEGCYQADAVGALRTDHHEICCVSADIAHVFPDVVWHAEQPILRTAPAPLWLLSREVQRSGVKVVLTGEGADEMFGGYDIFKEAKLRRYLAGIPRTSPRTRLLRRLCPYLPGLARQSDAYLSAFFLGRDADARDPLFSHQPRWELTGSLKTFFSDDVRSALGVCDRRDDVRRQLPADFTTWHPFCQSQYLEKTTLLSNYILSAQGDRMAMAHSVETRFPFLDYRVVEFAARLPVSLKMKVLNEKYLLKRAMSGLVPPSIVNRKKQPYRAPEGRSFVGGATAPYVDELLSPARIRDAGLFDPKAVGLLVEKFRRNRVVGVKDNMAFVGILSSQLVVDAFVNNFRKRAPHAA
jgi:asparagine synthase (glutamine-hydrolysing)